MNLRNPSPLGVLATINADGGPRGRDRSNG